MALSKEDLVIVRNGSLPLEPDAVYLTVSDDDTVTFTARGRELYRVSMIMHDLDPDRVDAVKTKEDLRQITHAVFVVRLERIKDEAREALRRGDIPVMSRGIVEAAVNGSLEDFSNAVRHRQRCEAAGENIVPFPLRRRWPRRAVATGELSADVVAALQAQDIPEELAQYDHELDGWDPEGTGK